MTEVLVAALIIVMVLIGTAFAILTAHHLRGQADRLYVANSDLRTASMMMGGDVHHAVAVATYDPSRTDSECSDFGLTAVHLDPALTIKQNSTDDGATYLIAADSVTGTATLVRNNGTGQVDLFPGLDPDCSGFLPGQNDYKNGVWVYLKLKDGALIRPLSLFLFPGGRS